MVALRIAESKGYYRAVMAMNHPRGLYSGLNGKSNVFIPNTGDSATALVPKSHANPTRFHGVFAPNSKATPAKRGKKPDPSEAIDTDWQDKSRADRHRAMTWMQRLKRVFNIDIEICGGHVKVIASIEDSKVIELVLKHLKQKAAKADAAKQHELAPEQTAPRVPNLFDPLQFRLFDRCPRAYFHTLLAFTVSGWGGFHLSRFSVGAFRSA